MIHHRIPILFLLILLLAACTTAPQHDGGENVLHHATLLEMHEADSFTLVRVKNPWAEGRLLATYVMVDSGRPVPHGRPVGQLLRVPLRRAVLTSAVHAALLAELGAEHRMAGLTDAAYVVSPRVKAILTDNGGTVRPMGTAMQPDVEQMRRAAVDAVWVSPFENAGSGPLEALRVPLVQCADYMESSPLARAEWMRFYGRLMGCGAEADSLFAAVETAYNGIAGKVKQSRMPRHTVMCDLPTGATWYQPGGASTMGRLLADAGAAYLWADRKEAGSLSLDMESVFARARRADVWLVKYGAATPLTYASMASDNPRLARFDAWGKRHVWACNTLEVPFYDETPFHPERLLADIASLLHPDAVKRPSAVYYTPLH